DAYTEQLSQRPDLLAWLEDASAPRNRSGELPRVVEALEQQRAVGSMDGIRLMQEVAATQPGTRRGDFARYEGYRRNAENRSQPVETFPKWLESQLGAPAAAAAGFTPEQRAALRAHEIPDAAAQSLLKAGASADQVVEAAKRHGHVGLRIIDQL